MNINNIQTVIRDLKVCFSSVDQSSCFEFFRTNGSMQIDALNF